MAYASCLQRISSRKTSYHRQSKPPKFLMPTISTFFGIIIRMWHDDHPPIHIHAEYQGFEALVEVETGLVREGELPRKVASIVKEWCMAHQSELLEIGNVRKDLSL